MTLIRTSAAQVTEGQIPDNQVLVEGGPVGRRAFLLGATTIALSKPGLALAQSDDEATRILRQLAPQDRIGKLGGPPMRRAPRQIRQVTVIRNGVRQIYRLDYSRLVDITVFFANDSAALNVSARRSLERLAFALRNEILGDQSFLIAGHTNAVGDRRYNIGLSEERAFSVRDWLVNTGGIDGARLAWNGYGPDLLRNQRDPASPINRRVEVIAIDS